MAIQLSITHKDGSSRNFDLSNERTTIGRRRSCDLHVALPSVGGLHCEIKVCNGIAKLLHRDPESETLHNGKSINQADLVNNDVVQIGPVTFTVSVIEDKTVIRRM